MAHNKVKSQHYNGLQGGKKIKQTKDNHKLTNKQTKQKGELLAVSKIPEIAGSLIWNFLALSQ